MISDYRCFYCFTRAFEKLLQKENISVDAKNSFTHDMVSMYHKNWGDLNSPEFARELHCLLKSYTLNTDPYKEEKKRYNDLAIKLVTDLKNNVLKSADPFVTALRLAIAGNIIDFAVNDKFDLQATIEMALKTEFALDHSRQLKNAVNNSESVLYLGDNAGEIVFDKLFIETINHPRLIYAVRGAPVINDATLDDSEYIGMNRVAKVISNGYDAPSTIVHKSSPEFQDYFNKAGLILSKGQGNLEGLLPLNDNRIYFLLMVKCDVMAEFLKVRKGNLVVFNPNLQ